MYPPSYWKKLENQFFASKYLLNTFLGCGAYGAVFQAEERLADRVIQCVAIKIVVVDPGCLERQIKELQLAVKLKHPNLIDGITCERGEIGGDNCLGLAMELADNTLERYQKLLNTSTMPVPSTRVLVEQIARGLAFLHRQGIIHRDLKPANILQVGKTWKIADFGIARSVNERTSTYTTPSQQLGTIVYMPPESYEGKITPAWDLWSLGTMTAQLLTGNHPFPASTVPELMKKVLVDEPRLPANLVSPFREIVRGCLCKDPGGRWTADEVLKALDSNAPDLFSRGNRPRRDPIPEREPDFPEVTPPPKRESRSRVSARAFGSPFFSRREGAAEIPPTPPEPERIFDHSTIIISSLTSSTPGKFTEVIADNSPSTPARIELEMVHLSGGEFWMGSPDGDLDAGKVEKPRHRVRVTSFALGKYPVTQEQYEALTGKNPSYYQGSPRSPVERVKWIEAKEFCRELSVKTGKRYRLPSEAEWEYACRATSETIFHFGDDPEKLKEHAWYWDNANQRTHPVGKKRPNRWELHDMYGNVWEWCEDGWRGDYEGAPTDGRAWLPDGFQKSDRVVRGGSWYDSARYCRSACRAHFDNDNNGFGFRVACSL